MGTNLFSSKEILKLSTTRVSRTLRDERPQTNGTEIEKSGVNKIQGEIKKGKTKPSSKLGRERQKPGP